MDKNQPKTKIIPPKKLEEKSNEEHAEHPLRRLLVFQLKLAVDALRDIVLSPVSLICTLLDLSRGKLSGKGSYFEKLMQFGRHTEKRINLFEQHESDGETVDSVLDQVEDIVMKQYHDKNLTAKTMAAIKKTLTHKK